MGVDNQKKEAGLDFLPTPENKNEIESTGSGKEENGSSLVDLKGRVATIKKEKEALEKVYQESQAGLDKAREALGLKIPDDLDLSLQIIKMALEGKDAELKAAEQELKEAQEVSLADKKQPETKEAGEGVFKSDKDGKKTIKQGRQLKNPEEIFAPEEPKKSVEKNKDQIRAEQNRQRVQDTLNKMTDAVITLIKREAEHDAAVERVVERVINNQGDLKREEQAREEQGQEK